MTRFSAELEEELRSEFDLPEGKKLTEAILETTKNLELFSDDLTGLQNLKNLCHLTISPDEVPLEILKEIPWLQSLEIRNSGIENKDLHKIAELSNLSSVGIPSNENITTLHPLHEMKTLKSLDLSDNWRFCIDEGGAIEELSVFTSLEELCIDNIPISSISFLSSLTNLKVLEIADDGCNSTLKDISPLKGMKQLKHLNIWDHSEIEDYSVLKELASLNQAYLNRGNLEKNDQMGIVDYLRNQGCTVEFQE